MAPKKGDDAGAAEVQKAVDAENARGFRGTRVDPTPLEHYTVDGVLAGKPTPENDEDAAKAARDFDPGAA
jgi:hypothetical protein